MLGELEGLEGGNKLLSIFPVGGLMTEFSDKDLA